MTNMMYRTMDFLDREIVIRAAGYIALWTRGQTVPRYIVATDAF